MDFYEMVEYITDLESAYECKMDFAKDDRLPEVTWLKWNACLDSGRKTIHVRVGYEWVEPIQQANCEVIANSYFKLKFVTRRLSAGSRIDDKKVEIIDLEELPFRYSSNDPRGLQHVMYKLHWCAEPMVFGTDGNAVRLTFVYKCYLLGFIGKLHVFEYFRTILADMLGKFGYCDSFMVSNYRIQSYFPNCNLYEPYDVDYIVKRRASLVVDLLNDRYDLEDLSDPFLDDEALPPLLTYEYDCDGALIIYSEGFPDIEKMEYKNKNPEDAPVTRRREREEATKVLTEHIIEIIVSRKKKDVNVIRKIIPLLWFMLSRRFTHFETGLIFTWLMSLS